MNRPLAQGWLPLDFDLDPRPGLVTNLSVRWLEFGATPLTEPFFMHTVDKLRAAAPPPEIETSADTLFRISERLPPVLPAGFIFHISHCGSTLISNALRNAANTLVAAEATAFVRLARWYPEPESSYLRERWRLTRRRLFESTFRLFAHYGTGQTERLVVKFSSINLFGMKFVRETWPDVPCVLVVRDPSAVLVSSLLEQGWLANKNKPERLEQLYGWSEPSKPFSSMTNEEYCGQLLGRHLQAANEAVDDRTKVVDYDDLNSRRLREIAVFFDLELPPETEDLSRLFTVYSKDPGKAIPFQDDRARKRKLASPAVVAAAQQWAMPIYIELRGKGAW